MHNPETQVAPCLRLKSKPAKRSPGDQIGLTGTPLLGDDYNSKALFGGYIHKYYYNSSIKDGYTLRLIREEIETEYKLQLAKTLEEIEILKGSGNREFVYAHEKFVEPMLDYIVKDFEAARLMHADPSIGAMVICDSAAQAREMAEIFAIKYAPEPITLDPPIPFPAGASDSQLAAETARFAATLAQILNHLDTHLSPGAAPTPDQLSAIIEACAWAHAEWVRIHPFANGNGRTARLWANAIAIRYHLPPFIQLRPRPNLGYEAASGEAMPGNRQPTARAFRRMLAAFLANK